MFTRVNRYIHSVSVPKAFLNGTFLLGCPLTNCFTQLPVSEMPLNNCLFTKNNSPFVKQRFLACSLTDRVHSTIITVHTHLSKKDGIWG